MLAWLKRWKNARKIRALEDRVKTLETVKEKSLLQLGIMGYEKSAITFSTPFNKRIDDIRKEIIRLRARI